MSPDSDHPQFHPQVKAADPGSMVFLSANAGSGKTRTLVNRVARLLLSGAKPEHILCLTFTKAAAAEMQARLYGRLGDWAVMADEKLAEALDEIGEGARPLAQARALFAKALDTPGGLTIQTIHAFCEKLLRRFPLEAGLSPAFRVMESHQARQLAEDAKAKLLLDPNIAAFRNPMIRAIGVSKFESLLNQFMSQHDKIAAQICDFKARSQPQTLNEALFSRLGFPHPTTAEAVAEAFGEGLDWISLRGLCQSLLAQSGWSAKTGEKLLGVIESCDRGDGFDLTGFFYAFHTQKTGEFSKQAFTPKTTTQTDQDLMHDLADAAAIALKRFKAADMADKSTQILGLFSNYSTHFTALKSAQGGLDFNDLIARTKDLLNHTSMSEWVLYRLDGGLEHILVDEAQDTSHDQWEIVSALSEAFFYDEKVRTVFAVGDEKQSIYGFQGARPDLFETVRQTFIKKAYDAGKPAPSQHELLDSYRTLPAILSFIDRIFDDPDRSQALNFGTKSVQHIATRTHDPLGLGLVEIWPKLDYIPKPEPVSADFEADVEAVDSQPNAASLRLARQLALHIRDELAVGRAISGDKNHPVRPLQAGDILILVRKRDDFFEAIIRELKRAGVPVKGADRLRLEDHIAFQDLKTVMRFCFQPQDDLSLAVILRSPLCDVDEASLYELCHRRTEAAKAGARPSLWATLERHAEAHDAWQGAYEILNWTVQQAKRLSAFDLISRLMMRLDTQGRTVRQRFLTRLGPDCEDVLDETLNLALEAEGRGHSALAGFLDLCERESTEIKREQEDSGGAVRILTVHGAKGLEAPWVILPLGPNHKNHRGEDPLIWGMDDPPWWVPAKSDYPDVITDLKAAAQKQADEEGLRLFYVALTRARDRLTLCGYDTKNKPATGAFPSWYDMAVAALNDQEAGAYDMAVSVPFSLEAAKTVRVRTLGVKPSCLTQPDAPISSADSLPDWVTRPIMDVSSKTWRGLSDWGDEDRGPSERTPSPLSLAPLNQASAKAGSGANLGRFRRGLIIHKLFELLPDISPQQRREVAQKWLVRQGDLTTDQILEITQAVFGILEDDRFRETFAPGSRPEVAIAGRLSDTIKISGRLDRLVVTEDRVLVIDFKSNRPAPDRAEDAYIDYQCQMALSVALLRQIYPGRRVEAALLWTDGPKVTPLSDALIALRLSELGVD